MLLWFPGGHVWIRVHLCTAGEKMTGKGAATDILANRMRVCGSYFPTVAFVCHYDQGNVEEESSFGLTVAEDRAEATVGTRS